MDLDKINYSYLCDSKTSFEASGWHVRAYQVESNHVLDKKQPGIFFKATSVTAKHALKPQFGT